MTVDAPFHQITENRAARWLVTVDHATNRVPDWVGGGDLGIAPAEMGRHIAYDIGALGLAQKLATHLEAPIIWSDFSRLVIDPNRGEDDPTLVMQLYDGTVIPANRGISAAGMEERLARLHRPYHDALELLAARSSDTVICAIHSFTPRLRGRAPRPWEVGILHSHLDSRLALPLIAALEAEGICVGDNEPYTGHLVGDSIDRHALGPGRPNVLIELRQDLIEAESGQSDWAARLAFILVATLRQSGL
ncbi:predicted N-formylglutamate amidohydrolase [Rhodobacter sp. JA431]|uniref:N-formylglutamate amidohydrolase n=1 Tax=Rhodobacter sp. JA431 TaxID=570013 RepID=UPI000BCA1382|nr:N-formylglutamate amidohydrolase [Rhodobacter sp. JA431]SOC16987.1 predicted N-formylglutamate amidohydrolase [Rhodobacter sp. JA431]